MSVKSSLARGKWIEAQYDTATVAGYESSLARGKWIEACHINTVSG